MLCSTSHQQHPLADQAAARVTHCIAPAATRLPHPAPSAHAFGCSEASHGRLHPYQPNPKTAAKQDTPHAVLHLSVCCVFATPVQQHRHDSDVVVAASLHGCGHDGHGSSLGQRAAAVGAVLGLQRSGKADSSSRCRCVRLTARTSCHAGAIKRAVDCCKHNHNNAVTSAKTPHAQQRLATPRPAAFTTAAEALIATLEALMNAATLQPLALPLPTQHCCKHQPA